MSAATRPGMRSWRKIGINFVVGMAVGAGAALLASVLVPDLELQDAHPFGFGIGVMMLALGLYLLWGAAKPARAARVMGTEAEPGEDYRAEARSLRAQSVVSILAGAELMVISWSRDVLTGPTGPILLGLLLVNLIVQTWLNWRLWRSGDEFFRRVLVEASVIAFVASQFLIFLWAVAARFGYLPDPSALDIYVLLTALYLLGGVVVGTRRGLGATEVPAS